MLSIDRRYEHQTKVSSMLAHQIYRLKVTHGINIPLTTINTKLKLIFQNIFGIYKIEMKILILTEKF